jgi:hypothetical protein
MLVRRGIQRLKSLEEGLAGYAAARGFPLGRKVISIAFLVAKLAVFIAIVVSGFWVLAVTLISVALFLAISALNPSQSKDAYRFKAYGDPDSDYDLNRSPGQPDLKDL